MSTSTIRPDWPQVLAATVRFTHNLELAEAAVEGAFARARPSDSPASVMAIARALALHLLRIDLTYVSDLPLIVVPDKTEGGPGGDIVHDDRRALAYYLCHPTLPLAARVALMLRAFGGLPIREVAVRLNESEEEITVLLAAARAQLRADGIPYESPDDMEFSARVCPVLGIVAQNQAELCHAQPTSSTTGIAGSTPSCNSYLRPDGSRGEERSAPNSRHLAAASPLARAST